mmetsp:Transcript_2844/g.5850  ORF Transcript_2844/g.5850 Transcript_2844/m.5850 type:complete len:165 (-) Transcript_2844:818-1312(-)
MRITRIFENTEYSESVDSLGRREFITLAAKHKALLLQSDDGSNPFSVDEFASLTESLQLEKYEYVGGAAPRRLIPVKSNVEVFTANEAPPDQLIPFHHELAQVQNPPQYLFFYCDLPSETGGETALIDSTLGEVHHRLNFFICSQSAFLLITFILDDGHQFIDS